MGITVTIDLIAPLAIMPELVEATCRRSGEPKLDVRRWRSGMERTRMELPNTAGDRIPLFSRTLESDEGVDIECVYRSSRGTRIGVGVFISGRHFHLGYRWRDDGPLRVMFSMSDLAPGFLQDRYGHPAPPPGTEDLAIENAQELFAVVCGALESGDDVVRPHHAAMYIEANMRPPAACAMVYHRTIREFAHDVRRTWLDRRCGASPVNMWWHGDETHWVTRKPSDPFDLIFYRGDLDQDVRLAWLEGLTQRDADLAEALDDSEIAARLLAVQSERPHLRFLDFGQAGALVVGSPFETIWRAYRALAAP